MDKQVKEKKPQRLFDEEAKTVFLGIMERLKSEHGGSVVECWLCPKAWPSSWGEAPTGYSLSRDADGYGQFVLTGTATHRQKTLKATRLVREHFNERDDPRRVAPDEFSPEDEWIGGQFDSKTFARHDHGPRPCTSPACMNPHHLRPGPDILNKLDLALKKHKRKPVSPKALARAQDVIALFGSGSAKQIADKLGLKQWEVFRIIDEAGLPAWAFLDDLPWRNKKDDGGGPPSSAA